MHDIDRYTEMDWDEWARQPLTQLFRKKLVKDIENIKEQWACAYYTGETEALTMRVNTMALAGVDMLRQVIDNIDELKIPADIQPIEEGE